ncbi:MAG: hypothetical protein IJ137_09045 [Eubacterium sp.]|nr:hypothetical protein [Eubacterium sp.]
MRLKLLRQLVSMSLAVLMAVSFLPARLQAASPAVLKESGTIQDEKGEIRISNYIYKKSGDNFILYTPEGKEIKDISAQDVTVEAHGFYMLKRKGNPLTETALVSKEGKILIPYAQAIYTRLNDRFWTSTVALKETKNKEEAMIYGTDKSFSISPDKDDTLYTGKMTVYDVITGKEVPGIEITSPKGKIDALGDTLYVRDDNGNYKIYDKDGKVLVDDASSYSIKGGFYSVSSGSTTDILDSSLKKLFSTDKSLRGVSQGSDYLYYTTDSDLPVLMDKTGKELFTAQKRGGFEGVSASAAREGDIPEDVLVYYDAGGDDYIRGLIKPDGTEISKCIYSSISWLGSGYFEGRRKEGEDTVYDVFDIKGTLWAQGLKGNFDSTNMCAYELDANSGRNYYVFDKKNYTLKFDQAGPIGFGLLKAYDDKTDSYGLFDTITGKQLLKYEYKDITCIDDKVYAFKDGEKAITIFDVSR